jgi:hypothetical protein
MRGGLLGCASLCCCKTSNRHLSQQCIVCYFELEHSVPDGLGRDIVFQHFLYQLLFLLEAAFFYLTISSLYDSVILSTYFVCPTQCFSNLVSKQARSSPVRRTGLILYRNCFNRRGISGFRIILDVYGCRCFKIVRVLRCLIPMGQQKRSRLTRLHVQDENVFFLRTHVPFRNCDDTIGTKQDEIHKENGKFKIRGAILYTLEMGMVRRSKASAICHRCNYHSPVWAQRAVTCGYFVLTFAPLRLTYAALFQT